MESDDHIVEIQICPAAFVVVAHPRFTFSSPAEAEQACAILAEQMPGITFFAAEVFHAEEWEEGGDGGGGGDDDGEPMVTPENVHDLMSPVGTVRVG